MRVTIRATPNYLVNGDLEWHPEGGNWYYINIKNIIPQNDAVRQIIKGLAEDVKQTFTVDAEYDKTNKILTIHKCYTGVVDKKPVGTLFLTTSGKMFRIERDGKKGYCWVSDVEAVIAGRRKNATIYEFPGFER
jgi:hypothetical protein